MVDGIKPEASVRRKCVVLGFRRQSYYRRKAGHRPEELDQEIAELLHRVCKRFIAWGFWMVFHYVRAQGYPWNHKKVYRIWKAEGLHLRLPPKRPKIRVSVQRPPLLSHAVISELGSQNHHAYLPFQPFRRASSCSRF